MSPPVLLEFRFRCRLCSRVRSPAGSSIASPGLVPASGRRMRRTGAFQTQQHLVVRLLVSESTCSRINTLAFEDCRQRGRTAAKARPRTRHPQHHRSPAEQDPCIGRRRGPVFGRLPIAVPRDHLAEYAIGHVVRLLGDKLVVDVDDAAVLQYQSDRLKESAAPKSINEEVRFRSDALGNPVCLDAFHSRVRNGRGQEHSVRRTH